MVIFVSSTRARSLDAFPGKSIYDLRCESASKYYTRHAEAPHHGGDNQPLNGIAKARPSSLLTTP